MAGSHGIAVGCSRVHPRAQQCLKEVHVQRLAAALSLILRTCHAWAPLLPVIFQLHFLFTSSSSTTWKAGQDLVCLGHYALARTKGQSAPPAGVPRLFGALPQCLVTGAAQSLGTRQQRVSPPGRQALPSC